jgi:hypothetical protein
MSEVLARYTARARGLWNPSHEIAQDGSPLGELRYTRAPLGYVRSAEYRPLKGEVWTFERNPGLVRSQFTMWTEKREWLGSSVRFRYFRPVIEIDTGGKPFHLTATPQWCLGWSLYAPKTGEVARVRVGLRGGRIDVLRKLQYPLVLFAWFLASQVRIESIAPGPDPSRFSAG